MFIRTLSAVLWVMMLGVLGNVQAQDTCASLSRSDCDILIHSQAVMAGVNSAAFRLDLEFDVQDIRTFETISMRLIANGTYAYTPSGFTNTGELSPSLEESFRGLNSDISVIFEFQDSTAPSFRGSSVNLITFDVRLVEGIGYLQLDKTTSLANPFGRNWYGIHLVELITELLAFGELADFGLLLTPDTGSSQLNSEYLQRLVNVEHSGQQMAVFKETIEFAELLADPIVRDEVISSFYDSMQQQFRSAYTDSELRQIIENYLTVLNSMNMNITQMIGLDDGYLHKYEFEMDFRPQIEAGSLPTAPDPFGLTLALDIQMRMAFSLELAQFDNAPLTTAPSDAIIVPLDDLLPFLVPGSPL